MPITLRLHVLTGHHSSSLYRFVVSTDGWRPVLTLPPEIPLRRPVLLAVAVAVTALTGTLPALAAKPSSQPADSWRGGSAFHSSYDGVKNVSTDFSMGTRAQADENGAISTTDGFYLHHRTETCDSASICTSEEILVYGEEVDAAVQRRVQTAADLSSSKLRPTRVPALRSTTVCTNYETCVTSPHERIMTTLSAAMKATGPEKTSTYVDQFSGTTTTRYRPATAAVTVLGRTFDVWTEASIREVLKG